MFMDPSAFEAEDIERELTEAGLGIDNANSAAARAGDVGVTDDMSPSSGGGVALVGDVPGLKGGSAVNSATSAIPPSSGSSYGFRTGNIHHSGGAAVPRAVAENRRQHTPTYGRHSNKGALTARALRLCLSHTPICVVIQCVMSYSGMLCHTPCVLCYSPHCVSYYSSI